MGNQLVEVRHLPNLKNEAYVLYKRVNLWPMNGREFAEVLQAGARRKEISRWDNSETL